MKENNSPWIKPCTGDAAWTGMMGARLQKNAWQYISQRMCIPIFVNI